MPLYTSCPCRNSKDSTPYMAQMMRIFIVTPAATVNLSEPHPESKSHIVSTSPTRLKLRKNAISLNIGLKPKVQPNPYPCPIFWPSHQGPIILTENNIWILRLPYSSKFKYDYIFEIIIIYLLFLRYIYMGDNEKPFYRPKDFETLNNCRVLKGLFFPVFNSEI